MKNKYPLQKYKKMALTVATIGTVAGVSFGLVKLITVWRDIFIEPPKPIILTTPPITDPYLPISKPKPEPEPKVYSVPNPSKIDKLCKAVDLCKIIEGGKSYIETDEKELLAKKMYAWNELNEIAGDSTLWSDYKSVQSIANCVTRNSICDCFDPLTTKYCPN